jgi:hypothetical protein
MPGTLNPALLPLCAKNLTQRHYLWWLHFIVFSFIVKNKLLTVFIEK